MGTYEDELSYEQKMDQIAEQLEEMILNAFLKALKKIKTRNHMFEEMFDRVQKQLR